MSQANDQRPIIRRLDTQFLTRRLIRCLIIGIGTSELFAPHDVEQDRLVFSSCLGITRPLDRVAEALSRERRSIAVLQPGAQVESDDRTVLVEFPRLSGGWHGVEIHVQPRESLVIHVENGDLVRQGALLRVEDVRIRVLVNPQDLLTSRRCDCC